MLTSCSLNFAFVCLFIGVSLVRLFVVPDVRVDDALLSLVPGLVGTLLACLLACLFVCLFVSTVWLFARCLY